MKKAVLFLVLLIVVFASVLSACGSDKRNEGAANSSASSIASASKSSGASASGTDGSSAPDEVTITHPLGKSTVKTNPVTVVVFDYGTLDTLDKLGIDITALPKAFLPEYLSKYNDAKYEDAGTPFEPDFEMLNKLEPDVIFIGGRTAEAYEELSKIAPTIPITLDYTNYLESIESNAKLIGQIFEKDSEVAHEIKAYNNAAVELKVKAAIAGKALIVLATGGKISAYGPGSRYGIIHDVFGFAPVDDKIKASTHGQSISNEYIAEINPDILFVIDRDAVAGGEGAKPAKEVIENDLIKNTNAYKNENIIYLDPNYWYLSGGGFISDNEMIMEAAQAVQ